jgi:AcrR family transcriptional regulator
VQPKRSQQERRTESRRKLEEAAIASLVERGVGGTTTGAIARRAGLSEGALFQHYPTKQALLVAAVERLYTSLRAGFLADLASVGEARRELGAVRLLWRTFARPDVVATLELWASSRTDTALRAELEPMLESHYATVAAEAARLLPEAAAREDFDSALSLALAAMQGAAVGAVITGREPAGLERHVGFVARLLERRTDGDGD